MDNKRLFLIAGGFIAFLILFIIIGSFLFKSSKKEPSLVSPTVVPFEKKPFTGSTFNNTNNAKPSSQKEISIQQEVIVKSETKQIDISLLNTGLPVKEKTFEIYKDVLDGGKIKVLIKDETTGVNDAEEYIAQHFISNNTSAVPIEFIRLTTVTASQTISITPSASSSPTVTALQPTTNPQAITPTQTEDAPTEKTSSYVAGLLDIFSNQQSANKQSKNVPVPTATVQKGSTTPQNNVPTTTKITTKTVQEKNNETTFSFINILRSVFTKIDTTNKEAAKQALIPTPTPASSTASGSSTIIPNITPIANLPPVSSGIFADYGLPQPVAEGKSGYRNLLQRINSNPSMKWSIDNLLAAERLYESKGGTFYRYLTTTWIWTENNGDSWPDPYEINCNDSTYDLRFCPKTYKTAKGVVKNSLLQIGGYQAFDHRNEFPQIFSLCHPNESVSSVMQQVVNNSNNASNSGRNYKNYKGAYLSDIQNATIQDISPNKSIYEEKTQFLTTLLGKDPCIVLVMNAKTVYSDNIPAILKGTKKVSWAGYLLNTPYKQLMANIIAALIITERGQLP